ncbi:hypothetical protein CASFOL_038632 [Castilleja foliolosa]|uniref:Peptidase A1 domain-containing protein n=1 Tax=Castilleja foliolosa TaxID=1961234 RepID=A0ABD3BMU0_9LAMI
MQRLDKTLISFVTQTERTYKGIFSYCFPSSTSSTGFLKLRPRDFPNNVKFTHLIANPDYPAYYFINIISIRVGHVQLLTHDFGLMFRNTIIDSGTVITRLPMNVYMTMRNEFQNHMNVLGYGIVQSPVNYFDTCYLNNTRLISIIPIITFTFEGGVNVDLDASATLFPFHAGYIVCLAFVGNSDPTELNVFGNTQQKKLEVVYDVEGERLGFIPDGCP